ncbi:MAG: hypothetical protein SCALA702_15050 [Melioribacteraceae bacterium]|nr:MAG: hypothetical protein SCALA702_15050 [Melioribacteraceae bacterium]
MRSRSKIISFAFAILALVSCKEETSQESYVVKINNSVLTEAELNNIISDRGTALKHREEFIREWIDTEILYREAVVLGFDKTEEFNAIIEETKKHLAGTLVIKDYVDQNFSEPGIYDVKKYFEEHSSEFQFSNKVYVLNLAVINGEAEALKFRDYIVDYDWGIAENYFAENAAVNKMLNEKFFHEYQLMPSQLNKIVKTLPIGEPSILLELEPGLFTIVEVVHIYNEGEIPEFDYVRENVKEKYGMIQKKKLIAEFMESLYSRYNIEIIRDSK